jgi:5-dehydro-4-deoxyglucarate dehydratase
MTVPKEKAVLDGVLFFPVTPFDASGAVDTDMFAEHVRRGVEAGPGGIFVACGTGEFHALEVGEYAELVRVAVEVVAGCVPVFAGAGGSVAQARQFARAAADAGADGLLLLPPYLVDMPPEGLVAFVRDVADATPLDVIVYHRGNARFSVTTAVQVAQFPTVVGLKDGVGDVDLMGRIVLAVRDAVGDQPFQFFNGLPTAEASQRAYRSIGVPLYSSAAFAFAPDLALAFQRAVVAGDDRTAELLLREFFHPLVALRDRRRGYAVALVKAGVRLTGLAVGGVRPPLVDPSADEVAELQRIIARGRAALATAAPVAASA